MRWVYLGVFSSVFEASHSGKVSQGRPAAVDSLDIRVQMDLKATCFLILF